MDALIRFFRGVAAAVHPIAISARAFIVVAALAGCFVPSVALARGGHGGGGHSGGGHSGGGHFGGGHFGGSHFGGSHNAFGRAYIGTNRVIVAPHWGRGYWGWSGGTWLWIDGDWWVTPEYPNWIWIGPEWVWDGTQWVLQPGYWVMANQ